MSVSMVEIPSRRLPIIGEADLVVVGGGSAGVAAAIAGAQSGLSVLLLEKSVCAGGMLTNGYLPSIIYMADGRHLLSGGLCRQLVCRVAEKMGVKPDFNWHNIHAEAVKRVLDDMLCENHVRVLFNAYCCDVLRQDERISGVVVSTPGITGVVVGRFFVDATGDGNLSAMAGVPFDLGNECGETMAPTLCSMWSGIDFSQLPENRRQSGIGREQWHDAQDRQEIPLPEHHFVGFFRCGQQLGCANLGHQYGCHPLDPESYTKACMDGRRQAEVFLEFFREKVPGFQHVELAATAAQLGVRETRRIRGDYRLTGEDYQARRHFHDDIGSFAYPIDIHAAGNNAEEQAQVEKNVTSSEYAPGENYGIPYRALLAQGTSNLLLAGRDISTDRFMQSSIRVVPGCMITGEAAGLAAALAVHHEVSLRQIPLKELQKLLVDRGIHLPS